MKNHERVERELLEQCGQVATLFRVVATMRRVHRATRRTLSDAKRPRLAVGHRQYAMTRIARLADAKTQLKCLCTLASTRQKISCLAHSRIVFRPVWWSTWTTSSRGNLNTGNVIKRVRNSEFYAVERHYNEHRVSLRWTINANKIIIKTVRYTHRFMQMVISMSSSPRWRRSKNFRNATADGHPHLTVNVNKN